jgi:hypothetical protein
VRFGAIISNRLTSNSSIAKPAYEDRLHEEHEKKGKQERQHRPESLVFKDVEPAKSLMEGIEQVVQHDLLNLLQRVRLHLCPTRYPKESEFDREETAKP